MARILRAIISNNEVKSFELWGSNFGGLLMLISLVIMSIAIISMLLFGCADGHDREKRRGGGGRRHASVYSATGGDAGGYGMYGGHSSGDGGGSGGCGGGGGS